MIDVNYLLEKSNVMIKNISTKRFSISEYKKELEEYKKEADKIYPFTLRQSLSGNVRMIKSALYQIQVYCDKRGVKFRTITNYGWLFGEASFIIEGEGTEEFIDSIKRDLDNWMNENF